MTAERGDYFHRAGAEAGAEAGAAVCEEQEALGGWWYELLGIPKKQQNTTSLTHLKVIENVVCECEPCLQFRVIRLHAGFYCSC